MKNSIRDMKTIEEVCDIFKVHFRTVYLWIRSGKMNAVRIGKRLYVSDSEISYIQERGLRNKNVLSCGVKR